MDLLDCRSPRRCPTCEHWLAGGCDLERQLAALDAPRAQPVQLALGTRAGATEVFMGTPPRPAATT